MNQIKVGVDIIDDLGVTIIANELPEGYTKLSYLENSHSSTTYNNSNKNVAYIDTGIVMTTDLAIETKMQVLNTGMVINGSVLSGNGGWIAFGNYGAGKLVAYFSTGSRAGVEINEDTNWHTYYISNGLQKIDDIQNTNSIQAFSTTPSNDMTIKLFILSYNWSQTFTVSTQRISYCKIWKSGELIRDMIPCINPEQEYGMYDKVNKTFYGSSSEYTFTGQ